MVKNPPCNTWDSCLIPGQGIKIPHAAEQLSLSPATTESTLQSPYAATRESMHFNKRSRIELLLLLLSRFSHVRLCATP